MRVIMTGGTSGIGLAAARRLADAGASLTIGARRPENPPPALAGKACFLPLDLADLASAAAFADRLAAEGPIDALVLNAGLQTATGSVSVQGLELTFAANHLAHFVILRRLAPLLAEGGRVVITSSGTHDPALRTGMPPPLHADARRLARPDGDPEHDDRPGRAGRRAYSASKLCNVMTARELARRLAASRPDIAVAAFDPGFTPGTGLARDYPAPVDWLFRHALRFVVRGQGISTPEVSGRWLADLASGAAFPEARGAYLSVRHRELREVVPSALARDHVACKRLWEDSEALLAELGYG